MTGIEENSSSVRDVNVPDMPLAYELKHERMRLAFGYMVLIFITLVSFTVFFTLFYLVLSSADRGRLIDFMFAQPGAVLGIPSCGMIALFIVLILRTTQGPIEFEGFGFKFRGASGPIIMWILCFLSSVSATKLLWLP